MKPEDIEFQLSQLLDGQLDAQEAQALRQHMARDGALAEQYRQYQALEAKLGGLAGEETSVDWDLQREWIHAKLERQTLLAGGRNPVIVRLFRWSAAAAAAAAVIAGIVLTGHVVWPSSRTGSVQVTYVVPTSPAPPRRPVIAMAPPADVTGHLRVRYSEGGNLPEVTQARRDGRGMVIITGGAEAASAATTLDLDDDL